MTIIKRQEGQESINYYHSDPAIAAYLEKELLNLKKNENLNVAGEGTRNSVAKKRKYVRKDPKLAKNKKDNFTKIFQRFVDLVYFLEFIEDHEELHELYEDNLKELFGFTKNYELTKAQKHEPYGRRTHNLFARFIRACLFSNRRIKETDSIDFRAVMANWLIEMATNELEFRIPDQDNSIHNDEQQLYKENVKTAKLHSRIIASKYDLSKDNERSCNHRIGYLSTPFKEGFFP